MYFKVYFNKIIETQPNSSERAHLIENIIDTEITMRDMEFPDMQPDDLRKLKADLISLNKKHRLMMYLQDLKKLLDSIKLQDLEDQEVLNIRESNEIDQEDLETSAQFYDKLKGNH